MNNEIDHGTDYFGENCNYTYPSGNLESQCKECQLDELQYESEMEDLFS